MNRAIQTLALVALAGSTVPGAAFAHGGQYRGPGDTVPPGGGGGAGGGAGPATGPARPGTGTTPAPVGPGRKARAMAQLPSASARSSRKQRKNRICVPGERRDGGRCGTGLVAGGVFGN